MDHQKVIATLCWTELEVVQPGNSDCSAGDRIITDTENVLGSFDIDGYDTYPHCNGAGAVKHDFRAPGVV